MCLLADIGQLIGGRESLLIRLGLDLLRTIARRTPSALNGLNGAESDRADDAPGHGCGGGGLAQDRPGSYGEQIETGWHCGNCVKWYPNVDPNVDRLEVCGEQNSEMMSQRQGLPSEVMRLQNRIAEVIMHQLCMNQVE